SHDRRRRATTSYAFGNSAASISSSVSRSSAAFSATAPAAALTADSPATPAPPADAHPPNTTTNSATTTLSRSNAPSRPIRWRDNRPHRDSRSERARSIPSPPKGAPRPPLLRTSSRPPAATTHLPPMPDPRRPALFPRRRKAHLARLSSAPPPRLVRLHHLPLRHVRKQIVRIRRQIPRRRLLQLLRRDPGQRVRRDNPLQRQTQPGVQRHLLQPVPVALEPRPQQPTLVAHHSLQL